MKNRLTSSLTLAFVLLAPALALAGNDVIEALDWPRMLIGLFGGLALFLFGMEQMGEALKAAAGLRLKEILARLTTNRFSGAVSGAFITAVIQSSSVTTVLVVGFVSAGLMTLNQSIGVIMGANIGTTITAQIIAFKITKLALAFIAVGFATSFFSRQESVRQLGCIIFGVGLIFFGMNIMGEAMGPLRNAAWFTELMLDMERPILGLACGAIFTALIQASAATTGIVVVMASQGFITLPAGIAVALGANIGTCITALLAATGKPRSALRAASVHVIFNMAGALLWLNFIDLLALMATNISPAHPELTGLARMSAETPRQIANANTLFNILNTLLFIGLTGPLASLVNWLFPDKAPPVDKVIVEPKFLDNSLIDTPGVALNVARLEVGRLGEQVLLMMMLVQKALGQRNLQALLELEKQDDAADLLHAEINRYLSKIGKHTLTEEESQEYFRISQANATFESIGDVIETDLGDLCSKIIRDDLQPSETMQMLLTDLFEGIYQALEKVVCAVTENDIGEAREVIAMKDEIFLREHAALQRRAQSLAESDEDRMRTLNTEFELTDKLKRIYTLSKRVARFWIPKEV